MKKLVKVLAAVACVCAATVALTACGRTVYRDNTNWISPMIALTSSTNTATVFSGSMSVFDRTQSTDRRQIVIEDGVVTPRGQAEGLESVATTDQGRVSTDITSAGLVAGGALRTTMNFAYNGDTEFYGRFSVVIGEIVGAAHSVTPRDTRLENVLVLFQNNDGEFYNIHRNGIGHTNTGGTAFEVTHTNGATATNNGGALTINSTTATNFANVPLYLVGLRPGVFVVTIMLETPMVMLDPTGGTSHHNGHFHQVNVVASTSFIFTVTAAATE